MSKKRTPKTAKKSRSKVTASYHSEGVRELACALIEQAFCDLRNEVDYKSQHQKRIMREARESAAHFFKSRPYRQLCTTLQLPANRIFKEALKT